MIFCIVEVRGSECIILDYGEQLKICDDKFLSDK